MKRVFTARMALAASACLLAAGCVQPPPTPSVNVCDPNCSERPREQVNQDLKRLPPVDGRIAALEEAAQNDARAAYDLGLRYLRGDGIARDGFKGVVWLRKAGEGGDLQAQKALGRLYLTGFAEQGRDAREAQTWLQLAAGRGDKESAKLLAEAEAARQSEDAEYKFLQTWRPLIQQMLSTDYPYYGDGHGHGNRRGRSQSREEAISPGAVRGR
ncbi:MAG: sel1 repeat family protein [Azoarcus sp.]|jgi:hypothetical protein|nr:sel1 repeat family protein [Azoarcus sp.]